MTSPWMTDPRALPCPSSARPESIGRPSNSSGSILRVKPEGSPPWPCRPHARLSAAFQDALGRCWIFRQHRRWPPGSGDELAATVGAEPLQLALCANGAEGALEGADPGLGRFRGQIPVAAFTVGANLKHASGLAEVRAVVRRSPPAPSDRARCGMAWCRRPTTGRSSRTRVS
jgi:hypothetical protein